MGSSSGLISAKAMASSGRLKSPEVLPVPCGGQRVLWPLHPLLQALLWLLLPLQSCADPRPYMGGGGRPPLFLALLYTWL